MSNNEAKFILGAYRPNGADAHDPVMAGVLEQARRDPALGAWFARTQAFDAAMAGKLRSVQPPAGLRASILAGGEMSAARDRNPLRQPRPLAWAAAAGVAVLVALAGVWTTHRASATEPLDTFAADYIAAGGFHLSERSERLADLRDWLREHDAPLPAEIPGEFGELRSLGCKTVDYRGRDISLICFGKDKVYHLFVANRDDFPMLPERTMPQLLTRKGLAVAAWSDAKRHYVVVTKDSMDALRQTLGLDKG